MWKREGGTPPVGLSTAGSDTFGTAVSAAAAADQR